jgi:hypothetical protein
MFRLRHGYRNYPNVSGDIVRFSGFQVENPINRFAIGDRDALKFKQDSSLDLHIQHEDPGPGQDSFFNSRSKQLAALTGQHAVPTIYSLREFAAAGGLMSYGGSLADQSPPKCALRCLSNSSRCAWLKNSWFAYSAGRCRGVSNSSVQIP